MDLEKTSRYIAQLSKHGYRYAILGKLRRYDKEIVKAVAYGDFEFYLCRLKTKREVIGYCLSRSEGPFKVYCLSSKPLDFPNAPLKLHYDEKTQRLRLLAQKSFINDCLRLIEEASDKKYPDVRLYTRHINDVLRKLYGILAHTYNDKERIRAIRRKVKHWYIEALKRHYGYDKEPKRAMQEYKQYVVKFSDILERTRKGAGGRACQGFCVRQVSEVYKV